MRKYLILLLSAVSLSTQAQNKIEFEEYDLDNGLHVILHKDESAPIVAVTVMYHVGSKNENPDRTGFAHFFEHLLFEGSKNIERGEYDNYVEKAGGMLNANTSMDRTFYYEVLPSNQLQLGLWLESERMLHARVDEKGINTQKEVVKEEKRLRIDNRPYGNLVGEVFKRAYQQHPYKWQPIGSMDHIDAASEEDYKNFYKTFYVPNNACLSIAGDIDIDQAKQWIDMYFSGIPKGGEIPRPTIGESPLTREIRDVVYDNIQLPAVVHGYRIPEQGTKDYYALEMLSKVLSSGESSRMQKEVVNKQQLALVVNSFTMGLEDPGMLINFGIAGYGKEPKELEASMDEQYEKLRTELISERELKKVQNMVETEFVTGFSAIRTRAEYLANYYMYYGKTNLINTELQEYMKVTAEDIKRVANTYLVNDNRVSLYFLPKTQENDN